VLCCAAPADTGYLITPQHTNSYPEVALGRYAHINAFLNSSQLCAAVDAVLGMPFTVRLLALSCFLHSSGACLLWSGGHELDCWLRAPEGRFACSLQQLIPEHPGVLGGVRSHAAASTNSGRCRGAGGCTVAPAGVLTCAQA
jgi:hypothetical protein